MKKQINSSFLLRGESYKDGMLLLIDHLTPQEWKAGNIFAFRLLVLKKNVKKLYADYTDTINTHATASFQEKKTYFDHLLQKYDAILHCHTTLKVTFESLLMAESCATWERGRETLKTSGPSQVVQCEIPCCDNELLSQEYATITVDPPHWFKRLPLWLQTFIQKHAKCLTAKTIPSLLRCIPGLVNMSRHDFLSRNQTLLSYFRHATCVPIDLIKCLEDEEEAFRLTCLNVGSQIRLALTFNKPENTHFREVVILVQSLLTPGKAAHVSSWYYSDPSSNDTKMYEMTEKAIARFQEALKDPSRHEAFLATWGLCVHDNHHIEYQERSFARITLLSTNHPLNGLRRFGVYSAQTQRNHCNTALLLGAVGRYMQTASYKITEVLSNTMCCCAEKQHISSREKKYLLKELEIILHNKTLFNFSQNMLQLLCALQAFLSIPPGQGSLGILGFLKIQDKHHRQSLISTMEAMVVHCLGGTLYISCKSGKDRTAFASAAMNAAALCYLQVGRYPQYKDKHKHRVMYIKLYADLLVKSGHHQRVASQNALGAEGLIMSKQSIPGDLRLEAHHAQRQTQLARLNKPTRVKAKATFTPTLTVLDRCYNYLRLTQKELNELKKNFEQGIPCSPANLVYVDWQRNQANIFISGKKISKLCEHKRFEDEEGLQGFIEEHLLCKIADESLKKRYIAFFMQGYHHGGYLFILSRLTYMFCILPYYQKYGVMFKSPNACLNFSPLTNGIQIEEVLVFNETCDAKGILETWDYYYQGHCCFSVTLTPKHRIETKVNYIYVDDDKQKLKFFETKRSSRLRSLFSLLRRFFLSLLALLKSFLKYLVVPKCTKPHPLHPTVPHANLAGFNVHPHPLRSDAPRLCAGQSVGAQTPDIAKAADVAEGSYASGSANTAHYT